MNKLTTLLLALCIFAGSAAAQTLAFIKDGVALPNNAEFTVSKTTYDEFGGLVLESGLSLQNLTGEKVQTTALQRVEIAPPSEDYGILNFCFDRCQEGNQDRMQTKELTAHQLMTPPEFHLCYFPYDEKYYQVKVRYEVIPEGGEPVAVTVTYDFNADSGTGIKAISKDDVVAFQEGNHLKFKFDVDYSSLQLDVYSILGNRLINKVLNGSKGEYALPLNLNRGIYVWSLKIDGKVLITRKIIIR
ncbi:MAG: T9SS type A sorting domain-containing protein [Dysgonamonadaceae bacterium]|jgi:hypothetical protein|nr:T9SS type A sorting domain-containing protein [Dysgonamonadaceae bacterium]